MDHLHEKEGKVQVQLNPKCHDGHLHAEEGEDQVQFNPERQDGHLQAEVVEDQIPPKPHGCHLKAEEGEYKVQLMQSRTHGDHLHAEEGEDQVQLNPERQGDHMHAEEGEYQVQLNAGSRGGHLHEEGRARSGSSSSTQSLSSSDGPVFAKHIHVSHLRCVHRSHFQSGFLNYSSQEQSIHPFTFTDSCKLRQISETLAYI